MSQQTHQARLAMRPNRTHISRMAPQISQTGTPAAVERAALRSWDNEGGAPAGGFDSKRPCDEKLAEVSRTQVKVPMRRAGKTCRPAIEGSGSTHWRVAPTSPQRAPRSCLR
jgi:hypothetical protein